MAAVADLKRDRAKLVFRASTRDLQLPRCFIRQPVLSSRFSSPDVARFERTKALLAFLLQRRPRCRTRIR